jgi:hypothetical protein
MDKKRNRIRSKGLTIIESAIVMAMATIIMVGVIVFVIGAKKTSWRSGDQITQETITRWDVVELPSVDPRVTKRQGVWINLSTGRTIIAEKDGDRWVDQSTMGAIPENLQRDLEAKMASWVPFVAGIKPSVVNAAPTGSWSALKPSWLPDLYIVVVSLMIAGITAQVTTIVVLKKRSHGRATDGPTPRTSDMSSESSAPHSSSKHGVGGVNQSFFVSMLMNDLAHQQANRQPVRRHLFTRPRI